MADSILRLRVENKEYDDKIRNSAEGIQHLIKTIHDCQGEFINLEKAEVDYIRGLQYMTTASKTATGMTNELSTAYKDLAATYNRLNQEEKNSEGGKALAESLAVLKQRAQEAKSSLDDASKSLNSSGQEGQNTSGIFDGLTKKLMLNIDAFKLANLSIKAVDAALKVAKDAFFASKASVDEFNKTMESGKAVYEGFLNALNTGDISGFLNNINQIVTAARQAYEELDKLDSMKTIQSPAKSAQEAENNRMRMMLMTGKWISAADGRKSPYGLKDGDKLSAGMLRAIERQLNNGMKSLSAMTTREIKQTGKAINAYYNSLAKQNGMSTGEFRKGTSSWAAFEEKMTGYENYKKWQDAAAKAWYAQGGQGHFTNDAGNPYLQYKKWGVFQIDKMGKNSYKDLVGLITKRDQQMSQLYSQEGRNYRTVNRIEGYSPKNVLSGGGRGGGGTTSGSTSLAKEDIYAEDSLRAQELLVQKLTDAYNRASGELREGYLARLNEAKQTLEDMKTESDVDLDKLFPDTAVGYSSQTATDALKSKILGDLGFGGEDTDMTTLTTLMQSALQSGIDNLDLDFASLQEQLEEGLDVPDEVWQKIIDEYNDLRKQLGLEPITIDIKTGNAKELTQDGKNTSSAWRDACGAINSVGQALQQVKNPAVKVVGIIAQAVANIALGFSRGSAKEGSKGVWYWIAATASGLATMISTISSIKSATKGYAGGGMIKGNSYSGDNLMLQGPNGLLGVNAGEIVLNASQQYALASSLQSPGMSNLRLSASVSGEQILLALNNNARRTGRGESVEFR